MKVEMRENIMNEKLSIGKRDLEENDKWKRIPNFDIPLYFDF